MSVKCLLKLSLLLKRQSPRNYCFKNCLTMQLISFFTIMVRSLNHSVLYTCIILGDPGAVSWAGRKGATKVFKYGRKSPWVLTFTGPFPNGQANAGSWLGTKNALYYCAQSANSISWVLFVSSYTTAIDSITAYLAHAPKKCTQSGNFQLDINCPFQNTVYPKPKDAFPKIQSWAYNRYLHFHRSRLRKY